MAYNAVKVHIFGIPEVVASLDRGIRAELDWHEPLELIAADINNVIRLNFESQGRRGGGSWKMLDRKTIKRKHSAVILIQSERLLDSVGSYDGPESFRHISSHELNMGTDVPYAATHQFGRDKIPARPFVKFIDSDKDHWRAILQEHLMGAMRGD